MPPTVYILCGIQFSGKSTLGRTLAAQRGWTHVEVDAIAESLLESSDDEVTEEQWTEAFNTSFEQVAASLARGQSVVHDATNYARVARDHVRAVARRFNAPAHVIYLAIPVEVANRRRVAASAPQRLGGWFLGIGGRPGATHHRRVRARLRRRIGRRRVDRARHRRLRATGRITDSFASFTFFRGSSHLFFGKFTDKLFASDFAALNPTYPCRFAEKHLTPGFAALNPTYLLIIRQSTIGNRKSKIPHSLTHSRPVL